MILRRLAPFAAALSLAVAPVAQAQHRQLPEYPGIHHPAVGERGMLAMARPMGHHLISSDMMGSAQSIMIDKGLYPGAADPRRPASEAVAP